MSLEELYKGKKIVWTGGEMQKFVPSKPKWIVENFIGQGDNVIIHSPAKVGKSMISMQIAMHMSSATLCLGDPKLKVPEQQRVLYVQAEMTMDQVTDRFQKMSPFAKPFNSNIRWLHVPALRFSHDGAGQVFVKSVEKMCPGFRPTVFFFDPIYMLSGGRSLKDDDVVQAIVENLNIVKHYYNDATIILNHHMTKPQWDKDKQERSENSQTYFGSFIFEAWPDVMYEFKYEGHNRRTIKCDRIQRSGNVIKRLDLILKQPEPLYFQVSSPELETEQRILGLLNNSNYSIEEISNYLKLPQKKVTKCLKDLIDANQIHQVGDTNLYGLQT